MERDPDAPGDAPLAETAQFAVMRHQFRNRIQTMTSLVGLFGRRLEPGPCRQSFEDLRARFEAVTFGRDDEAGSADLLEDFDLSELAQRVAFFLDPGQAHLLSVAGDVVRTSQRRGGVLAQILAELLIDLYRNGFGRVTSGAAEMTVEAFADGRLTLRVAQTEPVTGLAGGAPEDLGLALARSMARSLGGRLSRSQQGPFVLEVSIPPEIRRG